MQARVGAFITGGPRSDFDPIRAFLRAGASSEVWRADRFPLK